VAVTPKLYFENKMSFKFKNLKVWQFAMDLGEEMDSLAEHFHKKEEFNLKQQIRRSADSVALNISEGSTGLSNAEQKRFLRIANRSALEVVTCLHKARRRNYIDETIFRKHYLECEVLVKMLQSFISKIGD
jgi:four helix bundle protein